MAVPLKQLLADSKRLVARDLFDPANAEVPFTISSNDLPPPSRPAGGRTFRGACRRLINVSPVLRYNALPLAKRCRPSWGRLSVLQPTAHRRLDVIPAAPPRREGGSQ